MAVTTTVTLSSAGIGAGTVPASGSAMQVNLPSIPKIGLAIVYQEATPAGIAYYGSTSTLTATGTGTSTDGVPVPTANGAGAIPAQWFQANNTTTVYLAAAGAVPVSLFAV